MLREIYNRSNRRGGSLGLMIAAITCASGLAMGLGILAVLAGEPVANNKICSSDGLSGSTCTPAPPNPVLCSVYDQACYAKLTYASGSTCGGYLLNSNCTPGTTPCWSYQAGKCDWDQYPGSDLPVLDCEGPFIPINSPTTIGKCN